MIWGAGAYVDGDVDGDAGVLLPEVCAVVKLFGRVVHDDERVLGELLEEALWRRGVDVKVQRLGR